MPTTEQNSEARLAYELIMGRVSDSHWFRTKRLLKAHNNELTPNNIQFFAELRKLMPRSALGVKGLLESYRKAEELLRKSHQSFKGSEILGILNQYGIRPHQTTISHWFKSLGGYRKDREYSPEEVKNLLIRAFLYKAQFSQKLPEQKEIHHCG
jgi:hypothetical protein